MSHAGLGLREEPLYKGTSGAEDLGASSSPSTTPPIHSTQTHTPLCLRDTFPRSTSPLCPLIEVPPIPPGNQALAAAISRANTPRLQEPPSPSPSAQPSSPLAFLAETFFGNQKQPPTKSRPGSGPLPSRAPNHNRRQGVHPLHSLGNRLWHSSHHHPTRHRQHPAL